MKLFAGRPVVILNKKFAENSSIHVDERVSVKKGSRRIVAVVDVASGIVREDEIITSIEVVTALGLKEKEVVMIEPAIKRRSVELIYKKLTGHRLEREEIDEIIRDIVDNSLTEAEIAYFISAVFKCGMSIEEIVNMTESIVKNGKTLGLKGEIADKHSIGGVPGRTTPIVVSICAAAGLTIPKTSSRAITSPAGTADALEVICKVNFKDSEIKNIIKKAGACMVWGGSLNLSPADDKIIQVEKLLSLDPEPQLLASILAKKISVGAKYVLIDIPYGDGAKVNYEEALSLGKKFVEIGKHFNLKIKCSLNHVKEPLGNGIGPSLEIIDVIKILKREDSCYLLEKRALELAGELLELAGKVQKGKGLEKAKEILESGKAFEKFKQIIIAQQGEIDGIPRAKYSLDLKSDFNGEIKFMDIKKINSMARILGCPMDKYSGIYLYKHLNDKVKNGEKIATLYSESEIELKEAANFFKKNSLVKIC